MKGEWCYFKSYFSRNVCEDILKRGMQIKPQAGAIGTNNGAHADNDYRRSQVRFINSNNPDFTDLFDDLWKMAVRANDDFFGFHIQRLPFIQLAEYDSKYLGEYKTHHDIFWLNGDPYYHRKLTCVVQLSDPEDYKGGALEFIDTSSKPTLSEISPQGTAIFFPSFFLHKANPVTEGTRYSLASWFEGPKWR